MKNVIHENFILSREFYPLKILSSLVYRILSGTYNFIQHRELYTVDKILSSVETFFPNQTAKK